MALLCGIVHRGKGYFIKWTGRQCMGGGITIFSLGCCDKLIIFSFNKLLTEL
jgi:hypothetical protein